jgi:hypothetical protein
LLVDLLLEKDILLDLVEEVYIHIHVSISLTFGLMLKHATGFNSFVLFHPTHEQDSLYV